MAYCVYLFRFPHRDGFWFQPDFSLLKEFEDIIIITPSTRRVLGYPCGCWEGGPAYDRERAVLQLCQVRNVAAAGKVWQLQHPQQQGTSRNT